MAATMTTGSVEPEKKERFTIQRWVEKQGPSTVAAFRAIEAVDDGFAAELSEAVRKSRESVDAAQAIEDAKAALADAQAWHKAAVDRDAARAAVIDRLARMARAIDAERPSPSEPAAS